MFRLLTLGGLSLVDDGAPVTGAASQRSRLALLALLAAAGPTGVAREKVLACLWPESEDERARHALKQAVYALRRDLGSEHAISGTATLCLDASVITSDLREFEDAIARADHSAAVALYAGPFLDGVFVRGSAEFDQWAGVERARLERAHLDAISHLAHAAESAGEYSTAVVWWRRAAAAEPVSGRIALNLMRALAESGDVTAAMQHARLHDTMVRAELDAPADDAVLAFAEELRRGEFTPKQRASSPRVTPVAVVPDVTGDAAVNVAPEAVSPATAPSVAPAPVVARKRSKLAMAGIGLATLFAIALGGALAKTKVESMLGASKGVSNRLIVVAAFTNRTGDSTLNQVGELAADWIARRLVQAEFEVVDYRTSTFASRLIARTTNLTTPDDRAAALATETGAKMVVTGSYYLQGDTLQFEANILDPVRKVIVHSVGPLSGRRSEVSLVVGQVARGITASLAAASGTTPGSGTAALVNPPSVEAFEYTSRAWEMFFSRPADTTAVFAELAKALKGDTAYTAPRLMRAYVLDVKEKWADLAAEWRELDARRARMGPIELAAMALFESDLRGDLDGRFRASRELLRLSPGSADMNLLVGVSGSYLHHPQLVLDVLSQSGPDKGINILSPMYLAWRGAAEHALGRFQAESISATALIARFPGQLYGAQAMARASAAMGDTARLRQLLTTHGMSATGLSPDGRTLAMLGARELRAHGKGAAAAAIFAEVARHPPRAGATRDEQTKHALALYESGNYAAARAAFTALASSSPADLDAVGRLGAIAVRMGDSATVAQVETRLRGVTDPYAFGRPAYWRAHIAALTGREGEAIALLHDAVAHGYRAMDLNIITIHEEPDFMSLWGTPAFTDVIHPKREPGSSP